VVALAVERQHLERPGPDTWDRAQPSPAGQRVGGEQVDAAGRHLGGHAPQRERARRREVQGRQPRGRHCGNSGRRRSVAQPGLRATGAEGGDHPALDRDRTLELDQLLRHCVRQRFPWQRRAPHAQFRERAHRLADQRIVAELFVERAQVVVDPGRESQPPDPPHRVGLGVRARAEDHAVGRGLDDRDVHRRAVAVQQPLERGAAAPQQPVGGAAAQAERPRRCDLDAELVLHAAVDTGWGGRLRGRALPRRRKLRQ